MSYFGLDAPSNMEFSLVFFRLKPTNVIVQIIIILKKLKL